VEGAAGVYPEFRAKPARAIGMIRGRLIEPDARNYVTASQAWNILHRAGVPISRAQWYRQVEAGTVPALALLLAKKISWRVDRKFVEDITRAFAEHRLGKYFE
jgi:hypothetical protein